LQRKSKAKEIFNSHLASHSSDPVNVDSSARQLAEQQLDNPTPDMFEAAQTQVRKPTTF
jgi:hypothetical protein